MHHVWFVTIFSGNEYCCTINNIIGFTVTSRSNGVVGEETHVFVACVWVFKPFKTFESHIQTLRKDGVRHGGDGAYAS